MSTNSLSDYRARKAAAKAYHPSQWVWTPADAIETAQAFHAEIEHAERGVEVEPWYVTRSRARKAKWHNRAAVALLLIASVLLGAIGWAASARADSYDDEAVAYAAHYAGAVCATLADYTSVNGVVGVLRAIADDGLTDHQAGEAVALSVYESCPQYTWLLDLFIQRYAASAVTA